MSDLDRQQGLIDAIESRQGKVSRTSEGTHVDLHEVEGVASLVEALSMSAGLDSVTSLNLSDTATDDGMLRYLAGLRGLERLELRDTKVTDAGLEHLANLSGLKQLDLGRTRITDAGLRWLRTLHGLRRLTLPRRISMDALLALKEDLPNIGWIHQQ
jgi:hypothetical protein